MLCFSCVILVFLLRLAVSRVTLTRDTLDPVCQSTTPGAPMPVSSGTDPRSPLSRPPFLRVVGSDDGPTEDVTPLRPARIAGREHPVEIAEPLADNMPVNASTPILVDRRPLLIRVLTKIIVRIRWFPVAWRLLYSIPSEARRAWAKASILKEE